MSLVVIGIGIFTSRHYGLSLSATLVLAVISAIAAFNLPSIMTLGSFAIMAWLACKRNRFITVQRCAKRYDIPSVVKAYD